MRLGLAPRRVAGPLGLLALGSLLSELVTAPSRCYYAHGVDDTNWADVALHRGLCNCRLGGRVRRGISQRRKGRHEQQHPRADRRVNAD